jgi:hypothetical protein
MVRTSTGLFRGGFGGADGQAGGGPNTPDGSPAAGWGRSAGKPGPAAG